MQRVLGIDPGSLRTGWGIVERRGNKLAHFASGVITMRGSDDLAVRLREMHEALVHVLALHEPTSCAVEDLFQARFASSALKLGQARGVALLAAAQANLAVHAYAPALVKKTVGRSGAAEKAQVARIVGAILGLDSLPPLDATDALAIAITHAQASTISAITAASPLAGLRGGSKVRRPRRKLNI